jgi:5-methyltetrahydrofolate--homocysteine methyltransferase
MSRQDEIKQGLYDHTIDGHRKDVAALTEEALTLEMTPLELLFQALIPALQEVGRRFEVGDFFVPEMLMAAKAMQAALNILRPLLAETGAEPVGRVVMLTVKGDLHDIGKNLCTMMLEGAGFTVFDLGVNVSPEKAVEAVQEHDPHIVGMSAFLTTTMPMFKVNMDALARAGLRGKVKVLVGGAPVTQEFADKCGADGYAPDASTTARMATQIMADLGHDVSGGGQAAPEAAAAVAEVEDLLGKAGAHPEGGA